MDPQNLPPNIVDAAAKARATPPDPKVQEALRKALFDAETQGINIINAAYPMIGTDFKLETQLLPDGRTVTMKLVPITVRGKDFIELYLSKYVPGIKRKDPNEKPAEQTDKT